MEIGGALADLPQPFQHGGAFRRLADRVDWQDLLFIDETVERLAKDRPGVALVFHEFVDNRDRAMLVTFDKFD